MIFFKVLIILLVSAPISQGAKERVPTDTDLPVDPPISDEPCATNPCKNDGHCIPATDTGSEYFCQCSIGFYGANCDETDVALTLALIHVGNKTLEMSPTAFELVAHEDVVCVANPCQNTGRCISDTSIDTGYVCLCSMGWTGQNCEEKEEDSTRHLRVVQSVEDDSESRSLQSGNTHWACMKDGYAVDTVSIWFGHTRSTAQWACNSWVPFCDGKCISSALKLKDSSWYCYGVDPMVYVGQTKIWWGHTTGDATWACNSYNSACQNFGGCVAKNVWYFDSQTRYNSFIQCSGNGGACNVIAGISLNRFKSDKTSERVWGCGGAFQLTGATLAATLAAEPSADISLSFNKQESFLGWEGCCMAAGEALQSRGFLSDGWSCEKDIYSTGIYLKGKVWYWW